MSPDLLLEVFLELRMREKIIIILINLSKHDENSITVEINNGIIHLLSRTARD